MNRRLYLATLGSRGDVDPFVQLAHAAARQGWQVRLALPDGDRGLGRVEQVSLGLSFADFDLSGGVLATALRYRKQLRPRLRRALARAANSAVDWQPDVLVAHPKVATVAVAATALRRPWFQVELTPTLTPTSEFPAAGFLRRDLGRAVNRATFGLARVAALAVRSDVADVRRRLRVNEPLEPPRATLAAFSPALLPRPHDWPLSTVITGQWCGASPDPTRDERLDDFLAEDGPVAYAGFGSMSGGDAARRAAAIVRGARLAGHRTLLATGWGALDATDIPPAGDYFVVRSVAHERVLPRVSIAIHHGGVGTVHAATRAGVPSIVAPFMADQPFWAAHLHRRGLGGHPLDPNRLTPEAVCAAIQDAGARRELVRRTAERMTEEDGVSTALALLQERLG